MHVADSLYKAVTNQTLRLCHQTSSKIKFMRGNRKVIQCLHSHILFSLLAKFTAYFLSFFHGTLGDFNLCWFFVKAITNQTLRIFIKLPQNIKFMRGKRKVIWCLHSHNCSVFWLNLLQFFISFLRGTRGNFKQT